MHKAEKPIIFEENKEDIELETALIKLALDTEREERLKQVEERRTEDRKRKEDSVGACPQQ